MLLLLLPFLRLCEEESDDEDDMVGEWVDDKGGEEEVDATPWAAGNRFVWRGDVGGTR